MTKLDDMLLGEPEWYLDIEQGSPEWFELRRGIPTASEFQTILNPAGPRGGDGRIKYMYKLAGEILSGQTMESYQNAAMARGKEMEAEAREAFAKTRMLDVKTVGFVRRKLPSGRYIGASPDAIWDKSVLEIKTMRPDLIMQSRDNGYDQYQIPAEHKAQTMGALWVTGFTHAELIRFYRGMPYMLHYSAPRDSLYVLELEKAVIRFDRDLDVMVNHHRGLS
jgi:YqaJ-like viral recombinase domain